jgi:hypothetical protein
VGAAHDPAHRPARQGPTCSGALRSNPGIAAFPRSSGARPLVAFPTSHPLGQPPRLPRPGLQPLIADKSGGFGLETRFRRVFGSTLPDEAPHPNRILEPRNGWARLEVGNYRGLGRLGRGKSRVKPQFGA